MLEMSSLYSLYSGNLTLINHLIPNFSLLFLFNQFPEKGVGLYEINLVSIGCCSSVHYHSSLFFICLMGKSIINF